MKCFKKKGKSYLLKACLLIFVIAMQVGCGGGGSDDDSPGNNNPGAVDLSSVAFSSATYQVNENTSSITITVNRAGDVSAAISVDYAAANGTAVDGEDFSVTSGTLNWAANDSDAKTFDVQILSDSATEDDETVNLALSSPSAATSLGATSEAVLTIADFVTSTDPSSVSFSASTYSVSENLSNITITVERAGNISAAISVDYAAANGTAVDGEDFSVTSGTLNWAANDSDAKTFDVQILSDSATEDDETIDLALSSPSENTSLGNNTTAVLTISDVVISVCNGEITDRDITVDTTLNEPCYKVPNGISVNNPAKLTISPGVKLQFASGTQLVVNKGASLSATGTEAQPIVFTAQEATPGYWKGIKFNLSNSINNQLDYVTIEYAGGGDASTSGNITSTCFPSSPTRFSVTNSTIKDSFGWGVYQFGTATGGCNITLSNNTYSNNATGDVNAP